MRLDFNKNRFFARAAAAHASARRACALSLALCLAALSAPQQARAESAVMKTGALTTQPIGHYDFCRRYPQQCRAHKGDTAPVKLTPEAWQTLLRVNAAVNKAVRAATDAEIYGQEEYWEYPDKGRGKKRGLFRRAAYYGDCEDYALMKQRELEKLGFPAADLLITVVRKPDNEAHAVLSVRAAGGDYILDNLRNAVVSWQETEYRYIKRQSAYNAGLWVAIEQPKQNAAPAPFVAAINSPRPAGNAAQAEADGLASTRPAALKPAF